jgi:hypothetical protein
MYICIRLIAVLFLALFINPADARANKPEAKNKGTTKTAVNSTAAKPAKTTTKSTSKNSTIARSKTAIKATVKAGPKSQSANMAKSVAAKKAVAKAGAGASNKPLPKQVEKRSASAVLFAVSQNNSRSFIDPIVIIKDGKYTRPPAGDAPTAQLTRFANTYYREGQTYRLLFGGGEAGTVTVKQWNLRKACSRTEADAEIAGESKISGKVMGLATNSKEIGKRSRSRRFPTERERSAAEGLIKKLFKQKGVTEAQITQGFSKVNLTATDLNGDKKAELIATYLVKRLPGGTAAHILFSILEPDGKTYKVSTSQYGQITARDIGSEAMLDELGASALAEVLVDQIDLDKDGTAEVIIADLTKEGVVYKIFKKEKKGWQRAYEFANYRCGY